MQSDPIHTTATYLSFALYSLPVLVQVSATDDGSTAAVNLVSFDALPTLNGGAPPPPPPSAAAMDEEATTPAPAPTLELSESSRAAQEKHAAVLIQLEAARRAKAMFVPTDPGEVKAALRAAGVPITLFGEGPMDRRARLRQLLGEQEMRRMLEGDAASVGLPPPPPASFSAGAGATGDVAGKAEVFYSPATDGLQEARGFIAQYSFERAAKRLRAQASVAASPDAIRAEDAYAASTIQVVRGLRPVLSQPADDRPLTNCALTNDGSLLATCSWGSTVKVWDVRGGGAGLGVVLRGHSDRVMSVAWHPGAGAEHASHAAAGSAAGHGSHAGAEDAASASARGLLVSGSSDGTAKLWRLPEGAFAPSGSHSSIGSSSSASSSSRGGLIEEGVREVATLSGHAQRLGSVGFHPSGRFVATTSFDTTWRLWDVETASQLLLQEGHAREVYALAFHGDGSLVATGDLGGLGRVWDLRSGKSIFLLRGHVKQMLSLDFSPNGYHVASGSDDHTAIVWELRQQRTLYTIPAHGGLVSRVK